MHILGELTVLTCELSVRFNIQCDQQRQSMCYCRNCRQDRDLLLSSDSVICASVEEKE